jgi:hypothetical protein
MPEIFPRLRSFGGVPSGGEGRAMGFLKRLFGGQPRPRWPPPGPIRDWPAGELNGILDAKAVMFDPVRKMVDVVGEGSYQGTLERLAGGRTVDGGRNRDHVAMILPEPTNPYDPAAVRVVVITPAGVGATIGYLSREDAVAYRAVIDRVAADGKVVACRASLSGGWDRGPDDRGSFGVRLALDTPDGLTKELDALA